jgi:hypothetical protein
LFLMLQMFLTFIFPFSFFLFRVEARGLEPLTPALQRQCSTN